MKVYISPRHLNPKEQAYVRLLERQRLRRGYVRAFTHDPEGALTRVAMEYVAWFQTEVDARDALIFTPRKTDPTLLPEIPRAYFAEARAFRKHMGKPLCIGQALLLGADAYCPSVPLYRNYFDQMLSLASGYLGLRGTILLVHGNINSRPGCRARRPRFARVYSQLQASADDFYLLHDATITEELPFVHEKSRITWTTVYPQSTIAKQQFKILHPLPRGTPIAA